MGSRAQLVSEERGQRVDFVMRETTGNKVRSMGCEQQGQAVENSSMGTRMVGEKVTTRREER
jgi:hypothetical protein